MTALLASSAVATVLPPIEIGGQLLVDGAAAADLPLRQAVELGGRNLFVLPTAACKSQRCWKRACRAKRMTVRCAS